MTDSRRYKRIADWRQAARGEAQLREWVGVTGFPRDWVMSICKSDSEPRGGETRRDGGADMHCIRTFHHGWNDLSVLEQLFFQRLDTIGASSVMTGPFSGDVRLYVCN